MKNHLTKKIFTVADLLLRNGRPMSIRELSERSGIERSACWRIVADLCELGYLRKSGYRAVEPGLGMIYWGQAAYSEAFFPHRAIRMISETAQKLKVRTALAGLFHDQVIYLHRDGIVTADHFQCPLYGSNLAFCILYKKYGPEKTLELLAADAARHGLKDLAFELKRAEFKDRIRHMETTGFSLEESGSSYNISFPVERDGKWFALAFFAIKLPRERLFTLITHASILRNELEK